MDLDAFFVACERLRDPSLEGVPIIIGGGNRGVVAACSYETRPYGVDSAMPMFKARKLCPHARIIRPDGRLYSALSRRVRAIVHEAVPDYEFASVDEFYCDLTGLDRFFGAVAFGRGLRERIQQETGLPLSMGHATSKTVAKIATGEAKPNGYKRVPPGEEAAFLAPLPVGKIPMVGEKTERTLHHYGIKTIGQLQELSQQGLEQRFGKLGRALYKKAHGLERSPIPSERQRKTLGAERTFAEDIADERFLRRQLVGLSERIGHELRQQELLAGCLILKLRYDDFETHTHQLRMPYTNQDSQLLTHAHHLLDEQWQPERPVRLIGLRLGELVHGGYQTDLFHDTEAELNLLKTMDQLKNKYGSQVVRRANGLHGRRRS
jgi:DNA polymerase-4